MSATLGVAPERVKASLAQAVGVMSETMQRDSSDSSAGTRSPQVMRMRIARIGLFAWGFIGTVTALAGTYILILTNSGFGTPLDLLGCLLWGLGLPAGTMLASSTTGSIATTFNVTR